MYRFVQQHLPPMTTRVSCVLGVFYLCFLCETGDKKLDDGYEVGLQLLAVDFDLARATRSQYFFVSEYYKHDSNIA